MVLTAAHCVGRTGSTTSITAILGRLRYTDSSTGETIRSSYVYRSPQYPSTGAYDWALVELQRATVSPSIGLVGAGDTSLHTGDFTIMGWGATREGGSGSQTLRKATVPYVPDSTCDDAYGSALLPQVELCAGLPQGGVDTCQGDSGGPMVKRDAAGAWRQVGIVSWGNGCARPGFPGVYAEVQALASAITARISASGTIVR